jgi:uncharacterized membrane protein YtjA (UPF0391 family)
MVRASIAFFILGIVAYVLGANSIAGMSVELGKILLIVFLSFAVIGYLSSFITGRKNDQLL